MAEASTFRTPEQQEAIERVRRKRALQRFRGPVGWLMDQQLAVNLQAILRYSAAGEAIDPRNWMVARELDLTEKGNEDGAFWFDYLSDTGDGMKATYGVASLVHSNLYVDPNAQPGDRVHFERPGGGPPSGGSQRLPRGGLLVVGGDTAYQIADYQTLAERFQQPFNWAFADLEADGVIEQEPRRPIVAIPANHDYYDFLDGFNRQFRRPFNPERQWEGSGGASQPYLVLDGFKRVQWASYFSVALPNDWRIFGFDSQAGKMDKRQRHFFRDIIADPEKPTQKLILATPEPTTVLGKRCDEHAAIVETMRSVLRDDRAAHRDNACPFLAEDPESALRPGQCRLDLSGDVHQYARHWGAEPADGATASYASVVSGLGGAFQHPTSTDAGEVEPRKIWPPRGESLAETVRRCLDPVNVWRGGRVYLFGAIITLILFLGATASESVRRVLDGPFGPLPKVEQNGGGTGATTILAMLQGALALPADPDRGFSSLWHPELLYLPVLLGLAGFGVAWNQRQKRLSDERGEPLSAQVYRWPIWLLLAASAASFCWIFKWQAAGEHYGAFAPLWSNFIVLTLILTSFLGLTWCRLYDESMLRQARRRGLEVEDHVHLWALWGFTALTLLLGLTRYGVDSLAVVTTDLAFLLVVIAGSLGLVYFAVSVGGHLAGGLGKVGFGLFGVLHGALQLAAPVLMAIKLPPALALGFGAATVVFAALVGRFLPLRSLAGAGTRSQRRRLGVLLLGIGLAWIGLLIFLTEYLRVPKPVTVDAWNLLAALLLGAVLACVSLGWYLSVSLCFDGHNGEAGGGARIERYKQFIRFRVTEGSLTGYVIGFDEPRERYEELEPKLIDVFELRPKAG